MATHDTLISDCVTHSLCYSPLAINHEAMSCSHVTLNTFDQSNNFFLDAYNFCFTNHLSAFFPVIAWRLLNNVCTFGIGWISAAFLHKIQPLLEAQIYSTFCASPSHSERLITLRRDPSQEKKLELFHFHLINFAKFHDAIIQYAFAYKQKKSISYLFQLTQAFEGYESRGQSYFYPKWFSPKLLLLL